MRIRHIRPALIAHTRPLPLVLAICLALTSCTTTTAITAPAKTPSKAYTKTQPNATDIAWAQLMLAMNDRALLLLSLVPSRAANPALVRLTSQIRSEHQS